MVDSAQVAFVPGRSISENIVLAQEIVHSFKHMKRKKGFIGVKIDFQKAYDRMEWGFIIRVLKAFGFSEQFTNLIQHCISTVHYSLLLNGGICPAFQPERGLRQGDPLSPYLFILGSEVLMRLINRETFNRKLSGIKIARSAPSISKLCFADDLILFCKASMAELSILKECLEKYCKWSGQSISVEKSGVLPSKGVSPQFLNQIRALWGLRKLPPSAKYLGIPLFLTPHRKKDLNDIKERIESKLSSWKSKNLSWAGRATLIKSVVQAIPSYSMSVLQFPKGTCDQLDAIVRRFWWNPKSDKGSYCSPIAWDSLCWPIKEGGLGFRKFWEFNQALLAKLAWWLLVGKDCLCISILRAKYKVRNNWLNHNASGCLSPVWKSLEGVKHLVAQGACILIGSGESVRIWEDPWITNLPHFRPNFRENASMEGALVVSQLMDHSKTRWDVTKLNSVFDEATVISICRIPLPINVRSDKWIWTKTVHGELSVKSAYWLGRSSTPPPNQDLLRGQIWKTRIHERLKMVLWRVAATCLPTKDKRLRYDANADTTCHLCNSGIESILHLFTICPLARALWFSSQWGIRFDTCELSTPAHFIHFLLQPPLQEAREDFILYGALLCELIWRLRNEAIFEGRVASYEELRAILTRLVAEHRKFSPPPHIRRNRTPILWLNPGRGSFKINVDAAVGIEYSAVAVLARDWRGELVFACSKKVNTNLPLQAEAEALSWAVMMAVQLNPAPAVLESDSQVCVRSITDQSMSIPWTIENIILNVKVMAANLPFLSFAWVPREANVAAHSLANWSLRCGLYGSFDLGNSPSCFVNVIRKEAVSFAAL